MADYDPLIPQANDLISQSQSDILNNFGELETIFNNDHWTWDSTPSANRGSHRKISFPAALGSDPALAGFAGYLFLKNDPNDASARPQVYYKNITETQQVTNRFHSAVTDGYAMLPGGIILMWGFATPAATTSTIRFNTIANYVGAPTQQFPNNCFSVVCTPADESSPISVSIKASSTDKTKFVVKLSAVPNDGLYWYAIGN